MKSSQIAIARLGATVLVTGDPGSTTWIRHRSHRYFELDGQLSENGTWHIIIGREYAGSHSGLSIERGVPSAPCKFLFDVDRRVAVIDTPPGPWRWLWSLRLIRDLLRWQLFFRGAVFIHASVVAQQSAGLAMLGSARSGKSTLLLQLLRRPGWGLVADDDLTVVRKTNGRLVALGWPGCVRVRRAMLKFFPELGDPSAFTHPANDLEKNGDPETALLRLFPEEIADRFNCTIEPEVPLSAVVSTMWGGSSELAPLTISDTNEALLGAWDILPERRAGTRPRFADGSTRPWRNCCFNAPLFDFFRTPDDLSQNSCFEIASIVPGYRFRHTADPGLLESMLRSIGSSSPVLPECLQQLPTSP